MPFFRLSIGRRLPYLNRTILQLSLVGDLGAR